MSDPAPLLELMARLAISGADLARKAGTSRQQVHKLMTGATTMTREWAERLAPHLGVTWPEVMGWRGGVDGSGSPAPTRQEVLAAVGRRIAWVRSMYRESLERAAARLRLPPDLLRRIEAGDVAPDMLQIIEIAAKFRVSTDFLLLGKPDLLPHVMVEQLRELAPELFEHQSDMEPRMGTVPSFRKDPANH